MRCGPSAGCWGEKGQACILWSPGRCQDRPWCDTRGWGPPSPGAGVAPPPATSWHGPAGGKTHWPVSSPRSWGLHTAPARQFTRVQHVDGSTGRAERRFGWRSEQQEQPQMLLFTLFSHSAEQRAGGCQQLWGTRRSPCSPAQPIQGLEQTGRRSTDTAHLCPDGTHASSLSVKPEEEGHQDSPLVTVSRSSSGDSAESPSPSSADRTD